MSHLFTALAGSAFTAGLLFNQPGWGVIAIVATLIALMVKVNLE